MGAVTLYKQVIDVTTDYLGPAAKRFIDRQIQNHLHKQPADLDHDDLKKLIDWSGLALAMLTDDKEIVSEYTESLQNLSRAGTP